MPENPLRDISGCDGLVYFRKLGRSSHWNSDLELFERVTAAVEKAFPEDGTYSFYSVSTVDELKRVAVGLNSGRSSLIEDIYGVFFLPSEVQSTGATIEISSGNTRCHGANKLHLDVIATKDQIRVLCETAMLAQRPSVKLSKSRIKEYVAALERIHCSVFTERQADCVCI